MNELLFIMVVLQYRDLNATHHSVYMQNKYTYLYLLLFTSWMNLITDEYDTDDFFDN